MRIRFTEGVLFVKAYYLTLSAKTINTVGAYFIFIMSIVFSIVIYLDPSIKSVPPIMIWAIFLLVMAPMFTSITTLRRVKKPEIEISDDGLKLYRGIHGIYLLKVVSLNWTDITALAVQQGVETNWKVLGDRRVIKFAVKRHGTPKEISFSLAGVEDSDQLIADLKAKIPAFKLTDLMKSSKLISESSFEQEVKFGKLLLDNRGINKTVLFGTDVFIPWIKVRSIVVQSRGPSLAGYSPIEITYAGEMDEEKQIIINPRVSKKYHFFIQYLISHSPHASIDPVLSSILEYEPKEVYFDFLSLLNIIVAFFIQLIVIYFISIYAPWKNMIVFSLMVFTFTIPPIYMTVKYVAARESQGERHSIFKKTVWSMISILMPIVASIAILLLSPVTRYQIVAAVLMQRHDLTAAESYYKKALTIEPEDLNLNLSRGIYYIDKQQYERAIAYLEKVFNKQPCWGGPESAVLLPDTLYMLKRYDDALAWCDKMLKCDNHSKRFPTETIKTKRLQIASERKSISVKVK